MRAKIIKFRAARVRKNKNARKFIRIRCHTFILSYWLFPFPCLFPRISCIIKLQKVGFLISRLTFFTFRLKFPGIKPNTMCIKICYPTLHYPEWNLRMIFFLGAVFQFGNFKTVVASLENA